MRHRFALLVLALHASVGCLAYDREPELVVRDPHAVWMTTTEESQTRYDPSPGTSTPLPGSTGLGILDRAATLERRKSGALVIHGDVYVGANGAVATWTAADSMFRSDHTIAAASCYERSRSHCARAVWIVTPVENVRVLRERDVPNRLLGILESLAGSALVMTGAGVEDVSVGVRGALIGTGLAAIVYGIVQLSAPEKNERRVIPNE